MKTLQLLLPFVLILSACAAPVPVAVSCPPPAPLPSVLTEPVSAGPSWSEQYEILILEFRESLKRAILPE